MKPSEYGKGFHGPLWPRRVSRLSPHYQLLKQKESFYTVYESHEHSLFDARGSLLPIKKTFTVMGKKYHISERRISFAFINYRRGLNGRNRIASQGDRPITSGRYRLSVCISSLINGWLVIYDKIGFDFLLFPSHLFFIHTFLIYTRIPLPRISTCIRSSPLYIYTHTEPHSSLLFDTPASTHTSWPTTPSIPAALPGF